MAALLGQQVVTKDYERVRIRIAFNPLEQRFDVLNAATAKNPTWIPDVSEVFAPGASPERFGRASLGAVRRLERFAGGETGNVARPHPETPLLRPRLDRHRHRWRSIGGRASRVSAGWIGRFSTALRLRSG